ncbi:hypothetical protein C8J57DRAFT_1534363 [Mycena rebaudengoi]|nr:hypothetical protein C8J57DRAFT_1534363 [Mycena rebaudengoi]
MFPRRMWRPHIWEGHDDLLLDVSPPRPTLLGLQRMLHTWKPPGRAGGIQSRLLSRGTETTRRLPLVVVPRPHRPVPSMNDLYQAARRVENEYSAILLHPSTRLCRVSRSRAPSPVIGLIDDAKETALGSTFLPFACLLALRIMAILALLPPSLGRTLAFPTNPVFLPRVNSSALADLSEFSSKKRIVLLATSCGVSCRVVRSASVVTKSVPPGPVRPLITMSCPLRAVVPAMSVRWDTEFAVLGKRTFGRRTIRAPGTGSPPKECDADSAGAFISLFHRRFSAQDGHGQDATSRFVETVPILLHYPPAPAIPLVQHPGIPRGSKIPAGLTPDPSQSSRTGGPNPPFSQSSHPAAGLLVVLTADAVPPIEVVDALESEDDDPVVHTPPPRYSEKGKARGTSEEIDELESDEGRRKPQGLLALPLPDPAAQASTSNLDDPRQPIPPRPPIPPQMSFLGVPLEVFTDLRVFNMETLAHDTAALLQYYDDHPMEDRLEVHTYLEALFRLVGNELRGGDVELHISDWVRNAGSSTNPGGS